MDNAQQPWYTLQSIELVNAARNANLRAAGLAYHFAPQDDLRHYWLLVLGR